MTCEEVPDIWGTGYVNEEGRLAAIDQGIAEFKGIYSHPEIYPWTYLRVFVTDVTWMTAALLSRFPGDGRVFHGFIGNWSKVDQIVIGEDNDPLFAEEFISLA
jgi:hypothetical protein